MCDDCKEKTKDRKALKLHRLPEVLLIMLKRTMYPSTEKDDRHITFPLEASSPSDLQNLTLPNTPSSTFGNTHHSNSAYVGSIYPPVWCLP